MSIWLNNKKPIHSPTKDSSITLNKKTYKYKVTKPCHKLKLCPYGQLVEEFPIPEKSTKLSCKTFGHDCPVFYMAEPITE